MGHVDADCQSPYETNDKQYGDWLQVVPNKFFQLRSSVEKEKEARLVSELCGCDGNGSQTAHTSATSEAADESTPVIPQKDFLYDILMKLNLHTNKEPDVGSSILEGLGEPSAPQQVAPSSHETQNVAGTGGVTSSMQSTKWHRKQRPQSLVHINLPIQCGKCAFNESLSEHMGLEKSPVKRLCLLTDEDSSKATTGAS